MQYLILLHFPPGEGPQEGTPEYDAEMERWGQLMKEMRETGVMIGASGLRIDATTTVRKPAGEVIVTDGPYAETKEILFSFIMIDVPDLDAAIEWAGKMPSAEYGSVEVRPMVGYEAG
jgi:hypothetical protein